MWVYVICACTVAPKSIFKISVVESETIEKFYHLPTILLPPHTCQITSSSASDCTAHCFKYTFKICLCTVYTCLQVLALEKREFYSCVNGSFS